MPVKFDREYRSMESLMPKTQTKRIESDFYVEGYATTFNKPYQLYEREGIKYFEVIDGGALNDADMSDVIMQYDHLGRVRARTSNKTLGVEPDNYGLFTYADLSRSAAAKEMYEDITSGLVTKMSWAFTTAEDDYDRETHTRKILRVKKVYDVSAVSIPANSYTEISARSYFDGVIEIRKQELLVQEQKLELELELTRKKYFYMGGSKWN